MKNVNRHLDLSAKFMKMGQALIEEGSSNGNKDFAIAQVGTIMVFLSGLLLGDEEDINKFSDLCSMFSAKNILESLTAEGGPLSSLLNDSIDSKTYDDFIKRINGMKNDDENNQIN